MKWVELRARVETEVADDVAALLAQFGHGGSVVEQEVSGDEGIPSQFVTVKVYLPMDRTVGSKRRRLAEILGHLSLIYTVKLEEQTLTEQDWAEAWKAHFVTFRVGRRLVIKPSWREYQASEEDLVIELDPGMAFGTGLHPTTRLCLQALEDNLKPGWRVLDLGAGSGILSIASARLGSGRVLALDNDPVAVKVARANVRANGLSRKISLHVGSLPLGEYVPASLRAFDMVVANIIASVIQELAGPIMEVLKPAGVLIAGGIVAEKLAGVQKALEGVGASVSHVLAEGDWRTVVGRRKHEILSTKSETGNNAGIRMSTVRGDSNLFRI